MHLTFATHYCGGKVAGTKISVSGELASCGMEGDEVNCPITGERLSAHCCDDEVSFFSVDKSYTTSITEIPILSQNIIQVFSLPQSETFYTILSLKSFETNVSPPGRLFTSAVSLVDICVFRN
jgi:hypothetical protein